MNNMTPVEPLYFRSGTWSFVRYDPMSANRITIEVEQHGDRLITEPSTHRGESSISFVYADGVRRIIPFHNWDEITFTPKRDKE